MGVGTDANMRFVVEADNRASTELDRATASANNLRAATTLSGKSVEDAAAEFDRLYGPLTKTTDEMRKLEIQARAMNAAFDARRRAQMSRTEAQAYIEDLQRTREATAAAAAATEGITKSSGGAGSSIGRLNYQLAGAVASMDGIPPVAGRVTGVLASIGFGATATAGAIIAIGATSYVWREMADKVDGDQKMIAKLREEIERTRDALGQLRLEAANTELATANALLNGRGGAATVTSRMGLSALLQGALGFFTGGAGGLAAGYAGSLAGAQGQATADVRQATRDRDAALAESIASLIRHGDKSHEIRQRAIELLRRDRAELASLAGKFDDESIARSVTLRDDIFTVNDALFPKKEGRAADSLAAARFRDAQTDARRVAEEFARSLPKFKTATQIYDEQQKNGPMTAQGVADGARSEIAGDTGQGRANNALVAGYNRQEIERAVNHRDTKFGTHQVALPPDVQARMDAIAKESKTVEEAERKKRALFKETYDQMISSLGLFASATESSHNRAVKAVGTAANAIRRIAIGAEAAHAAVESARAFGKVPGALAIQDYEGAALWAASGTQLAAAAAMGFRESLGGGGAAGGAGAGGGYGGSGGPGTFRPDSSSHGPGGVTINLITKHPGSPDVVQSIMYQLNRADVLKVPPIEIPPAAGLIASSASGGH